MYFRFPVRSHLAKAAALQDGGGSVKPERSLQDVVSVVAVIKIRPEYNYPESTDKIH